MKPLCILEESEVEAIHQAALQTLANTGIHLTLPAAQTQTERFLSEHEVQPLSPEQGENWI